MRIAFADQISPDVSGLQTDVTTLKADHNTLKNKVNNLAIPKVQYIAVMRGFYKVTTVDELNANNRLLQGTHFVNLYNYCQFNATQIQFITDGNTISRVSLINTHCHSVGDVLTVRFLIYEPIFWQDTGGMCGISGLKFYDISYNQTTKQYTEFKKNDAGISIMTQATYDGLNNKDANTVYMTHQ